MPSLEIQFADDGCSVSTYDNCFIVILREPSTMVRLRAIRRVAQSMAAKWDLDTRAFTVLESSAMAMVVPDDIRKESAALTNDFPSAASVVIVEGEGFAQAAIRTFLAGIYLVTKNSYPRKIQRSVVDGARWVLAKTPSSRAAPVQVSQLVDAVESTRRAIRSPFTRPS